MLDKLADIIIYLALSLPLLMLAVVIVYNPAILFAAIPVAAIIWAMSRKGLLDVEDGGR